MQQCPAGIQWYRNKKVCGNNFGNSEWHHLEVTGLSMVYSGNTCVCLFPDQWDKTFCIYFPGIINYIHVYMLSHMAVYIVCMAYVHHLGQAWIDCRQKWFVLDHVWFKMMHASLISPLILLFYLPRYKSLTGVLSNPTTKCLCRAFAVETGNAFCLCMCSIFFTQIHFPELTI